MSDFEKLLIEGRIDDAERLAAIRLVQPSRHEEALTVLSRCALMRKDYDAAIRYADRNRRLAPRHLSHACFLSALHLAADNSREALRALDDFPAAIFSSEAFVARARALSGVGRNSEALALAMDAAGRYPASRIPLLAALLTNVTAAAGKPGWVAADVEDRLTGVLHLSSESAWQRAGRVRLEVGGRPIFDLPITAFAQRFGGVTPGPASLGFSIAVPQFVPGQGLAMSLAGVALPGPATIPRYLAVEGDATILDDVLSGWVWLPALPEERLILRVADESGRAVTVTANRLQTVLRGNNIGDGRYGFALNLRQSGLRPGGIHVQPTCPGLSLPGDALTGDLLHWAEPQAAGATRPGPVDAVSLSRLGHPGGASAGDDVEAAVPLAPPRPSPLTDIIVPVYCGREDTLACLSSVFATVGPDAEIVVIDDASPDPDLSRALRDLAGQGRITLLVNERNLGFPKTVNRGLALHPGRDVVVLNSDTLVSGDWFQRLRRAAYARPDVGTVTPLSNDAEILSYPSRSDDRDGAPGLRETAALHRLARHHNDAVRIEIPTAVAFCTYIRHDCLAATGPLESELFGRGYGEENDFCLRARQLGWRHLAAADVFVAHVGGRSFGRRKAVLTRTNLETLNRLHPGYNDLIRRFHENDPLGEARRRLDLARLRDEPSARPSTLLITFGKTGGVAHFVEQRVRRLTAEGRRPILLIPMDDDAPGERRCRVEVPDRRQLQDLVFHTTRELALLADVLRQLRLEAVELQHYLDHDPVVLELLFQLAVPFDVYVHDYCWICPQVVLIDGSGRYCGEPDLVACEQCVLDKPPPTGETLTVAQLRARSARVLAGARKVIMPSRDVALRIARHVPAANMVVEPWDDVRPPTAVRPPVVKDRWRVCVIGAVGGHKGHGVLLDCAWDAARRNLPLEFVIVGYTEDDLALFETGRVFITGAFSEEEVTNLVRREKAHLAFLPSVCPETWSYALSHAWSAGLTAVGFDIGAIAERIRAFGGHVLPFDLPAGAVNDRLLAILETIVPGPDDQGFRPVELSAYDPACRSVMKTVTTIAEGSATMLPFPPANIPGQTQITASAQLITFHPGFYSVAVVRGEASVGGDDGALPLPSIQLAALPATAANVEMLGDGWLFKAGEAVVVRVERAPSSMILTSYQRSGDGRSLGVQISRIDGAAAGGQASQSARTSPAVIRTRMLAHVQNAGDVVAPDGGWAGVLDQKYAIEGIAITPLDGVPPDCIEYKGLTANGLETPWIGGGTLCGSRGMGVPLTGLAIRLKGLVAERFECVYEIAFLSGARSPVLTNGQPYRSDMVGDPIQGLTLRIVERMAALPAPGFP